MYYNKNFKVDMWLVADEVKAHQLVMAWGMVFGMVVANVGASGGPVNIEVALAGAIPDPVEAHVDFLWSSLLDCVVCKTNYCGIIDLNGCGGFGMYEFFECCTDW